MDQIGIWRLKRLLYPALGLVILFASTTLAFAQTTGTATVRGTIKDPSGAVVDDVIVVLINEKTQTERRTKTNDEGIFVFTAVIADTYTVKAEAQGFKTYEQTGITVSPSDTRGVDISLEVGAANETVTVAASEEVIQKETGAKENTITAKQIENLSLIGRSSLELLRILPGVVAPNQAQLQSVGFNSGANSNEAYSVNGLRGQNTNISVDGSRVIDIGSNNGQIITINNDMVQEVKVQTSNYAAEHGSSGIQISATTKGGGREFHGTLYDYIRHNKFAANDRSNNYVKHDDPSGTAGAKPKSKFYYPGGNVGGPVILPWTKFNRDRDRMFFFVGFEVQRQSVDPGTKRAVVPTLKQRQGDFSEFTNGFRNPQGQPINFLNQPRNVNIPRGFSGAGSAAPNNNLAPFADPTGLGPALLKLYPEPNFTDPEGLVNYVSNPLQPTNRTDLKLRFDYKWTDKTNMYVRIAREYEEQDGAYGIWWGPSSYELPTHNLGKNLGRSVSVNLATVLNPTMTNEVVFSASKLKLDNEYADPEKVRLSSLGINNYNPPFGRQSEDAPISVLSWGHNLGNLWSPGTYPIFAYNDSFSITDNLSKVYNTHTLKFGALIEQANKKQNFQSDSDGTIVLGGPWNNQATTSDYGDLFVGRPAQFNHSTPTPVGHFRFYNFEFYGQDSWKWRPNVTFEYGLRVAFLPNNKERDGLDTLFDPNAYDRSAGRFINNDPTRPNGVLSARRGEIPKGAVDDNGPQFAPRLGFAWDIGGEGNLVLRGGAGVFYNRVQGNAQYDPALRSPANGFFSNATGAYDGAVGGDLTFARLPMIDPFGALSAFDVISQNPDSNNVPRTASMSLTVERRLWWKNLLSVGYVGTQARHLPARRQINYVPVGALLSGFAGTGANRADLSNPVHRAALSGDAIRPFRPFPVHGNIRYQDYSATSSYHSLQATLSRQAGTRLQYFLTYTFSKALGTTAGEFGEVDPIDTRGRSYGVLPSDRTHIFNASYNYELPNGARGMFDNWFGRGLFNGWQVSGITTFSSGTPIRLRFTGGGINEGAIAVAYFGTNAFHAGGESTGAIAPVFLRDPRLGGKNRGEKLLDINAIGIPGLGQSGPNVPPFYLRSPNRSNWDVTLFKNFQITETQKFQFRAGFFNLFNQAFPDVGQGDIFLGLETECVAKIPDGTPTGTGTTNGSGTCDPTKGFRFTQNTINRFGRIESKHGHRVIEFAFKYYF